MLRKDDWFTTTFGLSLKQRARSLFPKSGGYFQLSPAKTRMERVVSKAKSCCPEASSRNLESIMRPAFTAAFSALKADKPCAIYLEAPKRANTKTLSARRPFMAKANRLFSGEKPQCHELFDTD